MSPYFSKRLKELQPYTPGEQPKGGKYIKLNTNESPYFPSRYAIDGIERDGLENLRLYSDPESSALCRAIADYYGISANCVLPTNGSDEALAFCFAAFCDCGAAFPDVTYGFYKVFAGLFGVEYSEIPLKYDFTVDVNNYLNLNKTVFLANPNAQTGINLPLAEIEKIVKANPLAVVVIDEAYVDFGGESVVKLIGRYQNLVVVQTFSKSRSLAGARVGFAVACENLISGLKRVKYSFNPYNVNSISANLAAAAIKDRKYFDECTAKIRATRERLIKSLKQLNFNVLPSCANFVLAESAQIDGKQLYEKLKLRGILVRHFNDERINNFVRITVGTDGQTDALLKEIKEILK